jgi:predicted peroxiredoxin
MTYRFPKSLWLVGLAGGLMVVFPIAATLFLQAQNADPHLAKAPTAAAKSPIFINVTRGREDLHAASMAIGLGQNALKTGKRALLFFNVHAPVLVSSDLPANVQFADFPPVREMLVQFLKAGGEVYVCSHCAQVTKVDPSKLIKGAVLVHHGELFEKLPSQAICFSY